MVKTWHMSRSWNLYNASISSYVDFKETNWTQDLNFFY